MATNHEIARLRALAEQGVSKCQAARVMGRTYDFVHYWAVRERIVFAKDPAVIPLPGSLDAAQRLCEIMRQVTKIPAGYDHRRE